MLNTLPDYTGVLLCGGKSSRMKTDKAFLKVRSSNALSDDDDSAKADEPLFLYLLRHAMPGPEVLDGGTIISCRDEEQKRRILSCCDIETLDRLNVVDCIVDDRHHLGDVGPATGILSVHAKMPDRTLVVVAVDFPMASKEGVRELIGAHQASKANPVTLLLHPEDGNPEPLMSVWTSPALKTLRENASRGKSGPCFTAKQIWKQINPERGLEEHSGLVRPSQPVWVQDTDTPEEWQDLLGYPAEPWTSDSQHK